MRNFLCIFLLMLLATGVSAQNKVKKGTLSGTVHSSETGESLPTASLQLLALPDTVYKTGVASDMHGKFSIVAPVDTYILRVSYVGFVTFDKTVTVAEGKNIDIGKISLKPDAIALKGAEITAEVPPITVNEDTTVYNTAAFRVPAGS